MSGRQETTADIITEMRTAVREENPWGEKDIKTAWINSESILAYIDRIQAAWKRERNNAAAMRTVLVNIATEMIGLIETPKNRHARFQPQAVLDEIKQVIPELEGLYTSYQPNSEARSKAEIARLQGRSGHERGVLKPNRGE